MDAGVALLDYQMAVAALNGRLGSNPRALATAYAPELALTRSVLLGYPANETPPPLAPANVTDVTNFTCLSIIATAGSTSVPVKPGGLEQVIDAIDPFFMEYTDGLPMAEVGWGQLTSGSISQIFRLYDLLLNLEFRTPHLAQVQSSNVASHIVRSLVQAATGNPMTGTLGLPRSGRGYGFSTPPIAEHGRVHRPGLLQRPDFGSVAESNDPDHGCTDVPLVIAPVSIPVVSTMLHSTARSENSCGWRTKLIDPHSADLAN